MRNLRTRNWKKGSAAAEASIVLPLILMLVISVIFCAVKISFVEIEVDIYDLTSRIKTFDSMGRKADVIYDAFFE
ncbi:MAG TPA: hypothetical protein PLT91_03095 [Clostridia bacterium]|jgi:hypothetical protein|nr:MAG: hypothetical protein BWX97_02130 [Firmicutes bacterium ADurb.Bin146]HOD92550.1 hypothetical protein [Clostridia bacterium]HQM39208.1 hypothetical protein [Clostridia bacterium]